MNFNKNKRNKEEKGGRFSGLKSESSNPFKSRNEKDNSKRNNRNTRRQRENPLKSGEPKLNKTVSIMDLVNRSRTSSEVSNSSSSYVPPNQRNKNKNNRFQKNKRENNFKSKRPEKPKKVEQVAPDFENKELFPTLNEKNVVIDQNNPWSKKLVVKEEKTGEDIEETKSETENEEDIEQDNESENENSNSVSWAEMATIRKYQDKSIKEDDPRYIKPGWVRISYDKETHKYVHEYGAEVPETPLMKLIREEEKRRKQLEWEKRLQEWEEYDECMGWSDNYYYSWQADEVDAERELEARIAQMEQEEYEEEIASDTDSEEYEYYDY